MAHRPRQTPTNRHQAKVQINRDGPSHSWLTVNRPFTTFQSQRVRYEKPGLVLITCDRNTSDFGEFYFLPVLRSRWKSHRLLVSRKMHSIPTQSLFVNRKMDEACPSEEYVTVVTWAHSINPHRLKNEKMKKKNHQQFAFFAFILGQSQRQPPFTCE